MDTQFLPAERSKPHAVEHQSELLSREPNLDRFFSVVTDVILILNEDRQIVYHNRNLLELPGIDQRITGLRPGEAFNCIHAFESAGGCGTTKFCRECGAARAIQSSQKGVPAKEECRIVLKDGGGALDLQIKSEQFRVNDQEFTIVTATDISHEKRRRVLERLFFHDIMNTAVGVRGLAELLSMATEEQQSELREMIHNGSEKLIEEIRSQVMLTAAENDELAINVSRVNTKQILQEIYMLYRLHEVSKEKNIVIDPAACNIEIKSDKAILSRVVANMLKNALEASRPGDNVTMGCEIEDQMVGFWVHNPSAMPSKVKMQVFQRSFSTKGEGRGLGTYSMKLLSEKYLQGSVFFSSSEAHGTTFNACYPLEI